MKAKAEAERLILEYSNREIPIDLDLLAAGLNIKVIRDAFDSSSISGMLVFKEGRYFIGVNSEHSVGRQRFTIAHELGHYILHRKKFHIDTEIEEGAVMFRDDSLGNSPQEVEANSFAANLLMPEDIFKREFERLKSIEAVADRFLVSVPAAQFRSRNLGLRKL